MRRSFTVCDALYVIPFDPVQCFLDRSEWYLKKSYETRGQRRPSKPTTRSCRFFRKMMRLRGVAA